MNKFPKIFSLLALAMVALLVLAPVASASHEDGHDSPEQSRGDEHSSKDEAPRKDGAAPGKTKGDGNAKEEAPGGNNAGDGDSGGATSGGGASDGAPGQTKGDGSAKDQAPGQTKGDGSAKDQAPGQTKGDGSAKDDAPGQSQGGGNGKGKGKGKGDKGPKDVVPGNNGTIKIDGAPFGDGMGNEPHVGCIFQLDFHNMDQADGVISTVTFAGQAPTGGGTLLTDAVDVSAGEATATYAFSQFAAGLAGIEPHPQQGYHIKVVTSTPYSNGNDTKSKVFWMNCPSTSVAGGILPPPFVVADASPRAPRRIKAQVLGTRITREFAPVVDDLPVGDAPEVAGERAAVEVFGQVLPFTGVKVATIILVALVILGSGAAIVATRRST